MIKPKALKKGDTIGIVAPASAAKPEQKEKGKKTLEALGFTLVMGESCETKHGFLAAEDEVRAKDLNKMFEDPRIDGIICLRGGYGSSRILERLDQDMIRKNPKVLMGYSDITSIHLLLNQQLELITFHGPMLASDFSQGEEPFTIESFEKTCMQGEYTGTIQNPKGKAIECLVPGKAHGPLVGGNLAVVAASMGTPYEIHTKGKILFLEDVGEDTYKIDRMLTQLKLAGKLSEANGIIFGDFKGCDQSKHEEAQSLLTVLKDAVKDIKKPTIYNLQAGHCHPMITLPLGGMITLDAEKKTICLEEAGVEKHA
ncbi:muramoyltetrapeptide carboxypeptidase [Tindallia magadiensis]|uniref:Muramoyltetrapeptide carboxypeptidase n=1 Tax=Tindallia magadiensis TaxID=69895 RepID=A0A1I3GL66_9FIRM|nr:LD-carboxypeptidase [Tindallia magadiensis]SFI24140.1 muramoyltetrapeptide carboxypeptidase [Tindallia magadiensis]